LSNATHRARKYASAVYSNPFDRTATMQAINASYAINERDAWSDGEAVRRDAI
jgi:hypothetical protein